MGHRTPILSMRNTVADSILFFHYIRDWLTVIMYAFVDSIIATVNQVSLIHHHRHHRRYFSLSLSDGFIRKKEFSFALKTQKNLFI